MTTRSKPVRKCGRPHKALAGWTEAAAWGGDDVALLQDLREVTQALVQSQDTGSCAVHEAELDHWLVKEL